MVLMYKHQNEFLHGAYVLIEGFRSVSEACGCTALCCGYIAIKIHFPIKFMEKSSLHQQLWIIETPFSSIFPEGAKSYTGECFKGQPVGYSCEWYYTVHCEN